MKKILSALVLTGFFLSAFAFDFSVSAPKKTPFGSPEEYGIYRDLNVKFAMPYKVADEQVLCFDICYPKTEAPKGGYPLIAYFHGGGFAWGYRSWGYGFFNEEIRRYNENGIAVAAVSYRFARSNTPKRDMSACIIDGMDFFRYITKYAKNLEINPSKIGVYGHSAGGHLTFLVACANQKLFLGDKGLQNVKYKIACAVPQASPASLIDPKADMPGSFISDKNRMGVPLGEHWDDVEFRKLCSPAEHLKKNSPPILIIHGEKDEVVPVVAADYMMQKAKEVGADVKCLVSKNARHSFEDALSPDNAEIAKIRQDFFISHLVGGKK